MTDNTARLDHVVLWVRDPVAATGFYAREVGLTPVRLAEFTSGEAPFPSVRVDDTTLIDLMPLATAPRADVLPGAADSAGHPVHHICLALPRPAFDALHTRLREHDVPASDLAHGSFGARGPAVRSFYFRDPDGNIVEARHYD